jgi:hypothetical protein
MSVMVVSSERLPTNNLTGLSNDPLSGTVGSRPNGSREYLQEETGARKTFGRFPTDICYLEDELCVSDNLEDSK